MKIFLSYAFEDRATAEEISLTLAGAEHEVFFDRTSLPAGADFHARIEAAVKASDLVMFLISAHSIAPGSYTLTELRYVREKWPHPKHRVLSVRVGPVAFDAIPPYLRSVTVLEPEGNVGAEVASAVARWQSALSRVGQGGDPGWKRIGVAGLLGLLATSALFTYGWIFPFWGHEGARESSDRTTHWLNGKWMAILTNEPISDPLFCPDLSDGRCRSLEFFKIDGDETFEGIFASPQRSAPINVVVSGRNVHVSNGRIDAVLTIQPSGVMEGAFKNTDGLASQIRLRKMN